MGRPKKGASRESTNKDGTLFYFLLLLVLRNFLLLVPIFYSKAIGDEEYGAVKSSRMVARSGQSSEIIPDGGA